MKTDAEVRFYQLQIFCYSQHWFEQVRFCDDMIKIKWTLLCIFIQKTNNNETVIIHKTSFIRSQQMD